MSLKNNLIPEPVAGRVSGLMSQLIETCLAGSGWHIVIYV